MNLYKNIKTKENYKKLLNSGMFWEFYPKLSGNWEDDSVIILNKKDFHCVSFISGHDFCNTQCDGCEGFVFDTKKEITLSKDNLIKLVQKGSAKLHSCFVYDSYAEDIVDEFIKENKIV